MTSIEWTDKTWNPIVGCSVVSPGCTNCYAMKMAARLERMNPALAHYRGLTKTVNGNAVWTGKMALAPGHILTEPFRRKKPTMWFVNSMSDLFHEDVPDEWIDRVFAVMALCPQHTFQVLTKRSSRMRRYCSNDATFGRVLGMVNRFLMTDGKITITHHKDGLKGFQLPNVWLGVSAERQQEADARIPDLLETPAAVRFVSAEPLLGPIDFESSGWLGDVAMHEEERVGRANEVPVPLNGLPWRSQGVSWVIVGGESGPDSRPMHPDWARSIRDQCVKAEVPFFFKQWGEWAPQIGAVDGWTIDDDPEHSRFDHREWEEDKQHWGDVFRPMWFDFEDGNYDEMHTVSRLGKKRAGRLLDGREWQQWPRTNPGQIAKSDPA